MEITKVRGIIASEKPYNESSKLLYVITKEYGYISLIAKGAKSLKSKLRSVTTKLSYCDFQINYKEGKLSTLIDADIIDPFNNIKSDLVKISYASYLVELSTQVMKENYNENIFDLLILSLEKIESGLDSKSITNILELKYLSYLGISPELNECAICQSKNILTLSSEKGGFICNKHHTNEKIVDPKTLKMIRMLYYVDLDKLTKIDISDKIGREIDEFITEYYDRYSGMYLNTKKFLNKIKNVYI
ncbi:MAG: DNA repair protein RecO [Bacilli bacterium]|nr:DNA repair protein RecO [Bacilli bacterium]